MGEASPNGPRLVEDLRQQVASLRSTLKRTQRMRGKNEQRTRALADTQQVLLIATSCCCLLRCCS